MAENETGPSKTKVSRPKPSHPPFFEMAKAAISSLADKKGSSVPSIQTYIAGNYNIDIDLVKVHLKGALAKGIENETFVRPKGSDAKGYTGRFKLNKTKQAEELKAKAKKEKEAKAKPEQKTKTPKAKTKPKSATKSPKKIVKKKTPTKAAPKPTKSKATTKTKMPGTPKKTAKKLKTAALKTPKQTPAKAKAAKK